MESVRFVLGSGSPRRIELLNNLGLKFEVIPSEVEEVIEEGADPAALVLELSAAKARDVGGRLAQHYSDPMIVIGGDTIVVLDGDILGKPGSVEEAHQMLERLAGRWHTVFTGVSLAMYPQQNLISDYETSQVLIRKLSRPEIEAYVATGEPMDKAGAYALQGIGSALVERIEGCFTNIIGLPVPLTVHLLRYAGVKILGA